MTRSLYRLPWRVANSPTVAIRVGQSCGLGCCSLARTFTPLGKVRALLERAAQSSGTDSIALVGGEPAQHPDIVEIVRAAHAVRTKVVLCSNGFQLTSDLLAKLRDAGIWGVNLRINRTQDRPGWRDCQEVQIEGLRSQYAELVARVGGLLCGFELEVPDGDASLLAESLAWAERHVDQAQRVVIKYQRREGASFDSARPQDMAENLLPAGLLSAASGAVAATVAWRVGRRGSNVLAASPKLLRALCEYYKLAHGRPFAYLNPQRLSSQIICWLAAIADMSLRPLTKEVLVGLRSPSTLVSPRLASQFLFSVEQPDSGSTETCSGAALDSLSVMMA